MIKAIVSKEQAGGGYREVGMTDRTVLKAKTKAGIYRAAKRLHFIKGGGRYRIEFFRGERFYGDPFSVEYRGTANNPRRRYRRKSRKSSRRYSRRRR